VRSGVIDRTLRAIARTGGFSCDLSRLPWSWRSRWAPMSVAQVCPDMMKTASLQVASADARGLLRAPRFGSRRRRKAEARRAVREGRR
jgi:hypothetical protein